MTDIDLDAEAEAYRVNGGFQGDRDSVDAIRVAKIKRAILSEVPDDAVIEAMAKAIWRGYVGDSLSGYDKHTFAYDREKAEYVARAAYAALRGAMQ